MAFTHLFKAQLNWTSEPKEGIIFSKRYTKTHQIAIEGKELIQLSAAKVFKGDPNLLNPEDLLLSAVVSCHMMSYLYVCSQNGIEVVSYQDNAEATLEVSHDGSGRFVEIRLYPKVVIKQQDRIEEANHLHTKANALCFIANSCNFPILHFPTAINNPF